MAQIFIVKFIFLAPTCLDFNCTFTMAHGGNVDFSSETENEEFRMGACSGISTNVQKLTRSTNSNKITSKEYALMMIV